MWTLPMILLWLALALTIAAAVPRIGVPLWIPLLIVVLALIVSRAAP